MATYTVSAGHIDSGVTLNAGDVMTVLAGGSAVNVLVNGGASLLDSGTAIGTVITGSINNETTGSLTVYAGGVASGTVVGGGTTLTNFFLAVETVLSGGVAVATSVGADGELIVSSGASMTGTSAGFGGDITLDGTATGTTLYIATEVVQSGGVESGTTIGYAALQAVGAGGVASGASVAVGAGQAADAGGVISNTVVNGGLLTVNSGGTAVGAVLPQGAALVYGTARGLVLDAGVTATLGVGGVTTGTTVNSGATERISSGGIASGTTVSSGGTEAIYYGGSAVGTTSQSGAVIYQPVNVVVSSGVTSSGVVITNGSAAVVLSGGTISALTVSSGGNEYLAAGGSAVATHLLGAGVANIYGTEIDASLTGASEYVNAGGLVRGATLSSGATIIVNSGGAASDTTVGNDPFGQLLIDVGGSAVATIVRSGGEEQIAGGVASLDVVRSGGLQLLAGTANGSAVSATVSSGGTQQVTGGIAIDTVVSGGGSLALGFDFAANLGSSLDAVVLSGGSETVSGGNAIGTVVSSGGSISVTDGFSVVGAGLRDGITSATRVESGATLAVGGLGGSVNDVVAAGGSATVAVAGFVSGMALSGTLVANLGFARDVTVYSGGAMSLTDGATASATTVSSGGVLDLISGSGAASGSFASVAYGSVLAGGTAFLGLSATTTGTTISAGGAEVISAGATAASATVSAGGSEVVGAGGTATAATVDAGGTAIVASGGVLTNATVASGGVEGVAAGGSASFTTLAVGGVIDLPQLAFVAGGSASISATGLLTVTEGSVRYTQQLAPSDAALSFLAAPDAGSGTRIYAVPAGDTIVGAAAITLDSASPLVFPNVHVGTAESQTVRIGNGAAAPAGGLDVAPAASGNATARGTIADLVAGAIDSTDITVGLDTSAAGARSGTVTFAASSVSFSGTATPLAGSPQLVVSGSVFREATGSVAPLATVLHVGDSGTLPLLVRNTAANDGYSEALIAAIAAASGAIAGTATIATGDVLPGASSSALSITVPTTAAGVLSGNVTVGLTSDGGSGSGAIDGLGLTALGTVAVPVSVTVDNYASAALASTSPLLVAGAGANSYVLNFGTVQAGTSLSAVTLTAANLAAAPADGLDGSFVVNANSAFVNSGFAAFGTLAAGTSLTAGSIALDTGQVGTFSESLVLLPVDTGGTGFTKAQAPVTLTVQADVVPAGSAQGDVHMVTFDGLHYGFQAIGSFTLARSTAQGNPLDVQITTVAYPFYELTSVIAATAVRLGAETIGISAQGGVTVNGVADTALGGALTTQVFDGGRLTLLAANAYRIDWTSGETLTVTDTGQYLNLGMTLAATDGPGSMQGLLGSDSGQSTDFQLPDGTVLAQPLDQTQLLGAFAHAWSVASAQSLLPGDAVVPLPPAPVVAGAAMTFVAADHGDEILTGGAGPGAGGVTYAGRWADFAGDVLAGFVAGDRIDLTDLAPGAVTLTFDRAGGGGVLTVTDGAHRLTLGIEGLAAGAGFAVAADQHGGTVIAVR